MLALNGSIPNDEQEGGENVQLSMNTLEATLSSQVNKQHDVQGTGVDLDISSTRTLQDCEESPRVICRYGRGCTHMDKSHKEMFWHPSAQGISEEQYHSHYICNECSMSFPHIQDLQLHLKRKTAWSDVSLVGCRISCLVDNKEWHEGFVRSLSAYGKHLVDFHLIGERRWLNMKRVAFYIAERPMNLSLRITANGAANQEQENGGEYKDDYALATSDNDGLAPIEDMDDWVYVENITMDFAFAQSVLFKVFGNSVQETGHKTRGHTCLTDGDKCNAKFSKGSLLYGELLPRGANKAFGPTRLDCSSARVLFDLGMGTGKVAIQAFLQFRNLEYVYGVELSEGRYRVAEDAVLRMVALLGADSFHVQNNPGRFILITEKGYAANESKSRVLHLECGNLFDTLNIELADVVMLETDIPSSTYPQFCHFLNQMHVGARTLSYLDLNSIWNFSPFNFRQLECNRQLSDRFPTSWSVQRGHHFFIWIKTSVSPITPEFTKSSSGEGSYSRRSGSQHSRKRGGSHVSDEFHEEVQSSPEFGCMPFMFNFMGILNRRVGKRDVGPLPVDVNSYQHSTGSLAGIAPLDQNPSDEMSDSLTSKGESSSLKKAESKPLKMESNNGNSSLSPRQRLRIQVKGSPLEKKLNGSSSSRDSPHDSPRDFRRDSPMDSPRDSPKDSPSTSRMQGLTDESGDSMNTPLYLKSKAGVVDSESSENATATTVITSSVTVSETTATSDAYQKAFISCEDTTETRSLPDLKIGCIERHWDRSLLEPVSRETSSLHVSGQDWDPPSLCVTANTMQRLDQDLPSTHDVESTLTGKSKRHTKNQRGGQENSTGCTIS